MIASTSPKRGDHDFGAYSAGRSVLFVEVCTRAHLPSVIVVQVYQVIHEGVIKAAKKTNLARLGVGGKDVNRVFGRFVKELYILSQMHSDRCSSAIGFLKLAALLQHRPDGMRVHFALSLIGRST